MLATFEDISGFSVQSSYLFWAAILSIAAILLAILTAIATFKKRSEDGDNFSDTDVLTVSARVLVFLIFIAFLL